MAQSNGEIKQNELTKTDAVVVDIPPTIKIQKKVALITGITGQDGSYLT